jgi:hypothetical protein
VDLIRFCYWVKEFSSLAVDRVIEQATELSAERTFAIHSRFSMSWSAFPHLLPSALVLAVVQLQFQKEVEEKLHGCLTTLLETLTALSEV